MIRLLASVTREDEVQQALEGGADILDVKNPAEGSLGAPVPQCVRQIRALAPAGVPVSVAIGDAPMLPGTMALAALGAASCGVEYVKVGLCGPRTGEQAEELLAAVCQAVRESFPQTLVMAAGYADAREFGGVPPEILPEVARRAGAHGCMLDTLGKGPGRTLFDVLDEVGVQFFLKQCRELGLTSALAGSLGLGDMSLLYRLQPDIVGVRSAICDGDRAGGSVSAVAVSRLKKALTGTC